DGEHVDGRWVVHEDVLCARFAEVNAALSPEATRDVDLVFSESARTGVVAADRRHAAARGAKYVHAQAAAIALDGADGGHARAADANARRLAVVDAEQDAPADFRLEPALRFERTPAIDHIRDREDEWRRATRELRRDVGRAGRRLERESLDGVDD